MSVNKKDRVGRWYFGGIASAMAACCTHPLDLLKVGLLLFLLLVIHFHSFSFTVLDSLTLSVFDSNDANWKLKGIAYAK